MSQPVSRRDFLATATTSAVVATASTLGSSTNAVAQSNSVTVASTSKANPFRYCLNTATIRGQNVGIVQEVEIAAKAGYDAIEPWINTLDKYVKEGGSLSDLRKRIADHGLKVESAIGFAAFLVDKDDERQKGLDEAKRCMELVRDIGGTRLAAPPVGVTNQPTLDLLAAGERYRKLLELGVKENILPQLELWGFSKQLSRMGEVALVGIEASPALPAFLLDVYHIYKGGSDFGGLKLFPGNRMFCFHVNDYPAEPPRATIKDEHRVYPGDGVAPLGEIFRTLRDIGFQGVLSLELFNKDYWAKDAFQVAKTGLEKTKAAVAKALA